MIKTTKISEKQRHHLFILYLALICIFVSSAIFYGVYLENISNQSALDPIAVALLKLMGLAESDIDTIVKEDIGYKFTFLRGWVWLIFSLSITTLLLKFSLYLEEIALDKP
ncbi:hypothetical protein ACI2KR_30520 [Pseudomonas luteola]